jgi:hypothetical protein
MSGPVKGGRRPAAHAAAGLCRFGRHGRAKKFWWVSLELCVQIFKV